MNRSARTVIPRILLSLATLALAASLLWGVAAGRLSFDPGSTQPGSGGSVAAGGTSAGNGSGVTGPVEGGVLALTDEGRSIAVLQPRDGSLRGRIELDDSAATITPTPGGVSVFVTFPDRPVIEVYSTTEYRLQETIEVDAGVPEYLTFSENGDTLFVTYRESDTVSVFSHSQLELTPRNSFEVPQGSGPVVRNRRATRVYRQSEAGLRQIYVQNGALVETIQVDAERWRFAGGYEHLVGVAPDGTAQVLETSSGDVSTLPVKGSSEAGSGALAVSGNRTLMLLEGGERVAVLAPGSGEPRGELSLPFPVARVAANGLGTVWAVAPDGRIAVIDPARARIAQTLESPVEKPGALAASIVKQEGNFACF